MLACGTLHTSTFMAMSKTQFTIMLLFAHSVALTIQLFLLLIKQGKVTSTTGPLHLLFSQLYMFFLQIISQNVPAFHQVSVKCHFLWHVFSENTTWNTAASIDLPPILLLYFLLHSIDHCMTLYYVLII